MNHREESDLIGRGTGAITVILFIVFQLINISNLYSQQIISRDIVDYSGGSVSMQCSTSPYTGCVITLPPARYGESYSFTVPVQPNILRSDFNFVFSQKNSCAEGLISFSSNGVIEIESASSCKPQNNNFIEIDVKAVGTDLTDSIKYLLPILREPIKMVLVLDLSGSMALPVSGGTLSRWDVLKNSVDLFNQKLEVFKQQGDLIGMTYFSTEIVQPNTPISDGFIDISSETDLIRSSQIIHTDMASKGPSSLTAMGKGLLNAKQKLDNNNAIDARKLVLLFTDGLQNVEPLVNPDGVTLSSEGNLLNVGPCDALDSTRYYTVGIGGTTLVPEILGKIAQASGGISLSTTTGAEEGDLEYFFQNQFANMLEGGSPQIVSRKTGVLSSAGTTYSFPINGSVSKLYFELTSSNASGITLKVEKDGKDLTTFAKTNQGSFFKSVSFSLPLISPEIVKSEGDWLLTVIGNSSGKYSLICYVDDHFLDFDCKPAKSVYTVGDKLTLNAKLFFAGNPLYGRPNKIQATLLKPGDDLGDMLAQAKYTDKDSVMDVLPEAEAKLLKLIQTENSFSEKLHSISHTIEFEDEGNGIYTASYDNTDLSGVYQIVFTASGEIPGFGNFERQKQYSAVFKFGQINANKSNIKATINSNKNNKDGATATVTFKPKNDFGYCLGPGFLSRIKLSVDSSQGKVSSSKDNLDGSYTFIISDIPKNTKPDLRIMVMDETLYLGKFPSPKLYLWQFLVLILLIIALIIRYIFAHTGQKLLRFVLWVLLIFWFLLMVLQRFGIVTLF